MRNTPTVIESLKLRAAIVLAVVIASLLAPLCGWAGDWPQILGPHRNGEAIEEPAITAWGAGGPKVQWTYRLGQGFAGPAVVADRVVVVHRVNGSERVEAIDAETGKSQWQTDFEATYRGGINPDTGPRCVPLIHDGNVIVFGAAGDLHCLDLENGKKRWSRATYHDFDGREGYFGAGSTPLVAAGKVIVNVGGRDAGLVAFDLETGETAWQATDEGASYSSPAAGKVGGQQHVVFLTRLNTVSVNPVNGDIRFRFPFGKRGPTVNAATPLLLGDRVFVSAAYGVGANLSKITAKTAETLWANDEAMSSQYTTCVHRDGFLYGTHGREDFQNGELRCVAVDTGEVQWSKPGFGVAHGILVGKQILLLGVNGELRLMEANPRGYRELASANVSTNITRALPALSHGKLYVREHAGESGKLICLDLLQ